MAGRPSPRREGIPSPVVPASTRLLLGIAAVALLVVGVALMVGGTEEVTGGVLVRVALLLGAAWLVAPLVRRPSVATLGFLAAGALVLVRPRLIVAVAVGAVIWRLAQRRD